MAELSNYHWTPQIEPLTSLTSRALGLQGSFERVFGLGVWFRDLMDVLDIILKPPLGSMLQKSANVPIGRRSSRAVQAGESKLYSILEINLVPPA